MANNKDFIVKVGLEVNGSLNYRTGVISSGTVDLSTGCHFKETLSANTTYTFSNAETVQVFQIEITGASTYTITWPSSVDWAYGMAPDSPADGEIKLYNFITADGGTTYIGGLSHVQ